MMQPAEFPSVLILAGGLGTRISQLYSDIPKYLIPVNAVPFAIHQLKLLKKMGFSKIILCVGYQKEKIMTLLGDGSVLGLTIQYSNDGDQLLGTGGAIKKASHLASSPFCILYGDSFLDFDFKPVYQAFLSSKKSALMTVFHNNNKFGQSNVLIKNGMVADFNKEHPLSEMEYIDYGFLIFSRHVFDHINETRFDLSVIIKKLITDRELCAYKIDKRFYEIGTQSGIDELEQYLGV